MVEGLVKFMDPRIQTKEWLRFENSEFLVWAFKAIVNVSELKHLIDQRDFYFNAKSKVLPKKWCEKYPYLKVTQRLIVHRL